MDRAAVALESSEKGIRARGGDSERVARIAVLAGDRIGVEPATAFVRSQQQQDGGWIDNVDSIWCAALLWRAQPHADATEAALKWLAANRSQGGGWGRNDREPARIPLTALAIRFLGPELCSPDDQRALNVLWKADLGSDVKLSYKAGFYLLAQPEGKPPSDVGLQTIDYLHTQVNDDGGFGPWRDHPIGSDPWSTGICLAGLARFRDYVDFRLIERVLSWLLETQMKTGYLSYHFIDEGSAYAYWGLRAAQDAWGAV